jgi:hypothetical protein
MKKITLLLISLFSFYTLSAQIEYKFGLKGGVHYSGFSDDGSFVLADSFGFQLGLISEITISNKFSLQPELLYSERKGQDGTKPGDSRSYFFVSERSYIDLPIGVKYSFSDKFHIELGPQLSFLTSDKNTITPYSTNSNPDSELIVNDIDFSANLGFGYSPTEKIIMQLRLNYGFSKVVETFDVKNSMVSLGIGYWIFE